MNYQDSLPEIFKGRSVLFIGTGASYGATDLQNKPILLGDGLRDFLLMECEESGRNCTLDQAAQRYIQTKGRDNIISILKERFSVRKVASHHLIIYGENWKRTYTTNYDDVFEFARTQQGISTNSYCLSDNIKDNNINDNFILHINGKIGRLNRDTINHEFKLTETSYLNDSFNSSEWSSIFKDDLRYARAIFVLGYGLRDLDIARLLVVDQAIKNKLFIITKPNIDDFDKGLLADKGTLLTIGVDGFARDLSEAKARYSPKNHVNTNPVFVKNYIRDETLEKVTDSKVLNLLLEGHIERSLVLKSLSAGDYSSYYVKTEYHDRIVKSIREGRQKIVIHSHLGNGKSVLVEGIKAELSDRYQVYDIREDADIVREDVDTILASNDKVLLILHGCIGNANLAKYIVDRLRSNAFLLMLDRSSSIEFRYNRDSIIFQNTPIFDINKMSDLSNLVHMFNRYHLWGKSSRGSKYIADENDTNKENYFLKRCLGEWNLILLDLLNSPDINKRYKRLISEMRSGNGDSYRILLASAILSSVGIEGVTLNMLQDLLGLSPDHLPSLILNRESELNIILNINGGYIYPRSSILARNILRKFTQGDDVIDILIMMSKNADRRSNITKYNDICRSLQIHSDIEKLLPSEGKGKRKNVIRYYEEIRSNNTSKDNHHFWLQYAIARLYYNQVEQSRIYFDNAYRIAETKGLSTTNIDNHFSRYLFEMAIRELDIIESWRNVDKAMSILISQMEQQETLYYPYRQASNLQFFYGKRKAELSNQQVAKIYNWAKDIRSHAYKYIHYQRENEYVSKCIVSMDKLIDEYEAVSVKKFSESLPTN